MTPQQILDTPDLIAVGVAGDEVRRQMHGAKTTFNRVLELHVEAPPQALQTYPGLFPLVPSLAITFMWPQTTISVHPPSTSSYFLPLR